MAGRANRRLEQPREQVLEAALAMVAEQGLSGMTMASLAARLGTSGGHLLYYFGSKDQLLMETLRWSEASFAESRAAIAGTPRPSRRTLEAYADLYLPVDARDPRWLLWVELWSRSAYDDGLAEAQRGLDEAWRADLLTIVRTMVRRGSYRLTDPEGWTDRLLALMDGFSVGLVTGSGVDRDQVLAHVRAYCR